MEQTYRRCAAPGRRSGRRPPGAPPRRGTPEAPAGGLAKTPIHPHRPRSLLTPFPPPHPTPHPSFPPQPLGPARQRASWAWGRLAGAPALRRRRLPPSLAPRAPGPRGTICWQQNFPTQCYCAATRTAHFTPAHSYCAAATRDLAHSGALNGAHGRLEPGRGAICRPGPSRSTAQHLSYGYQVMPRADSTAGDNFRVSNCRRRLKEGSG